MQPAGKSRRGATTSGGGGSSARSRTGSGARSTSKRATVRSSGGSQNTNDHEKIRRWVESRGGHPATVRSTAKGKQAAGVLRIDFPGFSGAQSLKPISWDEFFQVFDQRNLTFLYQDKTASGKPSRFNKLVCKK